MLSFLPLGSHPQCWHMADCRLSRYAKTCRPAAPSDRLIRLGSMTGGERIETCLQQSRFDTAGLLIESEPGGGWPKMLQCGPARHKVATANWPMLLRCGFPAFALAMAGRRAPCDWVAYSARSVKQPRSREFLAATRWWPMSWFLARGKMLTVSSAFSSGSCKATVSISIGPTKGWTRTKHAGVMGRTIVLCNAHSLHSTTRALIAWSYVLELQRGPISGQTSTAPGARYRKQRPQPDRKCSFCGCHYVSAWHPCRLRYEGESLSSDHDERKASKLSCTVGERRDSLNRPSVENSDWRSIWTSRAFFSAPLQLSL